MTLSARHTLASWLALILLLIIWHIREPLTHTAALNINGVIAALPLLLFFPIFRKANRNGLVGLALICLPYFLHALASLYQPSGHWIWPLVELLATMALFITALIQAKKLPIN